MDVNTIYKLIGEVKQELLTIEVNNNLPQQTVDSAEKITIEYLSSLLSILKDFQNVGVK